MLNNIRQSNSKTAATTRTAANSTTIKTNKMKEVSSLSCGQVMPKQIVLVGTLLAEDTSFVYNDSCGLFVDYGVNQALASALDISGKLKPSTLRNVCFGLMPVIDMVTYKSTEEGQLNNDILFKTLNINGTVMREDIFQVAIEERNTQFKDGIQTVNLRPMEEVVLSSQTGVIVPAEEVEGQTTTIILKVDRWVPWSTALQMFGGNR